MYFNNLKYDFYDLYDLIKNEFEDVYDLILWTDDGSGDEYLFEDDEDAEEHIYEIIEIFDDLASKNKIEIFRILHLNSLSDLNKIELGECWAWNRKTALNFGYENVNNANFMLHGFTSPKNIDWKESIKRYAINSLLDSKEDELVVINSADVTLIDVEQL